MIGYRFLPPAEDEMIEAAVFYETASNGLGNDFLRMSNKQLIDCVYIPCLAWRSRQV
jgi:hypothetical protein